MWGIDHGQDVGDKNQQHACWEHLRNACRVTPEWFRSQLFSSASASLGELCAELLSHLSELRMLAGVCSLPSVDFTCSAVLGSHIPWQRAPLHPLLASLFRAPFPISLLPRSTVAQSKISGLWISTSAQSSRMNLLISVMLYPALPLLLPRDPNNIAWHLGLKLKDLDYSNKKANTEPLHFLLNIILPWCKEVWGTPVSWAPCRN